MEKPFDYKEFLKELEACQERSRKVSKYFSLDFVKH